VPEISGTVITLVLLDDPPASSTAGDAIPAGDLVARAVRRFETTKEGEREVHSAARAASAALRRRARQIDRLLTSG
jgi:hypothetical protein